MGDKALDETEDVHHTMDELEQKFSRIDINSGISTCIESGNLISKVMDNMLAIERGDKSIGLSSGFRSLDRCIGGFKPSELIIIAARPSVGKTAFALSIAANMAYGDNPVPIGFFSLEMSGASLMERILASKSRINMMKIRNGVMDFETKNRLMDTASFLYDYSKYLIVQDTPNIKLLEIRSQARLLVRQYHVKAIFIDYIGLVDLNPSNANMPRHEQVSQISRSLKQLARELEIPVICLCQVNRDAGKERPPMLADLRDSGSIEQDADLVLLMDDQSKRLDDKGKIAQYEEELEYSENKSKLLVRPIKIIIAKQRNGNTGAFRLNFVSDYVSFNEIEAF
jgi:replicative DNA helicase